MRDRIFNETVRETNSSHDFAWNKKQCSDGNVDALAGLVTIEDLSFSLRGVLPKEQSSHMVSRSQFVAVDFCLIIYSDLDKFQNSFSHIRKHLSLLWEFLSHLVETLNEHLLQLLFECLICLSCDTNVERYLFNNSFFKLLRFFYYFLFGELRLKDIICL